MDFKFNLESRHHVDKAAATSASTIGVSDLVQHGGIYKLMDADFVRNRLRGRTLQEGLTLEDIVNSAKALFYLIVECEPYNIHTSLVSFITSPIGGTTFSPGNLNDDNDTIPAFITFVGQFIDHDLTQNMINLLDPQANIKIEDGASPYIDLDSVYSRSNALTNGTFDDIFDENRKFRLRAVFDQHGNHVGCDLERDELGGAYIMDKRNDENQIILQIHILIERLHNTFMDVEIAKVKAMNGNIDLRKDEIFKIFNAVKVEVQRNWQSFIINEYLPFVVEANTLTWVFDQFLLPGFGGLDHKPDSKCVLNMPHEFAISFRMGHSMLRNSYKLRTNDPDIPLFNSRIPAPNAGDLAGSKPLTPDHVIEWDFFATLNEVSNLIDSKVTMTVFDLPESTIPDMVKQIVNLPQRNLIRSSQVALSHGEHIVDKLHLGHFKLTPSQIEADLNNQKLFKIDNDGNYSDSNPFRTPLWYYVLKEAEVQNNGRKLGKLGGRIVSEVIAGGIYYLKSSYINDPAWNSDITGNRNVTFLDIVNFVQNNNAAGNC